MTDKTFEKGLNQQIAMDHCETNKAELHTIKVITASQRITLAETAGRSKHITNTKNQIKTRKT